MHHGGQIGDSADRPLQQAQFDGDNRAAAACRLRHSDGRYTVEEAVRRLLQLSSQRAFARLTEPGGFYDDQLTRITPPDLGGDRGGAVLSALLRTRAVRDRVGMALNDVAVDLADNAAPIVMDAVQRMTLADAVSVLRGGPTAATDLLAREARGYVVEALLPGASRSLQSDMFEMLTAALSPQAAGIMRRWRTMCRARLATRSSAPSAARKRRYGATPAPRATRS